MAWGKCEQCSLVQYWKSGRRPNVTKWCCSQCGSRLQSTSTPAYAEGDTHRILPSRGICPRATEQWLYISYQANEDWKRRMKGDLEQSEAYLLSHGWVLSSKPFHYTPPSGGKAFTLAEALREQEKSESVRTVSVR